MTGRQLDRGPLANRLLWQDVVNKQRRRLLAVWAFALAWVWRPLDT